MTTRSMTYAEIAEAIGIAPKSARQLVQRKRWMRRTGNDGRVRVDVPIEALPPLRDEPPEGTSDGPSEAPSTHILLRLVERLEGELRDLRPKAIERDVFAALLETERGRIGELQITLEQMRAARDAERQKATEHDVLAAQVETLKVALEESRRERDRWAVQAHALAHLPLAPAPRSVRRRGLFGWLKRAG